MLKKFLIGTVVALALLVGVSASAAYDFGPTTLKVGSSGQYVMNVQTVVGAIADGSFGPMTKAKVMAWQAAHSLTADGMVGPATKNAMNAGTFSDGVTTYPAGCTSLAGFSSTTGLPCSTVSTLPAGCTSEVGYSPTTGAKCDSDGVVTPGTGALTGGAGDINLSKTTTNLKSKVSEGTTEPVLAFKAEADGSDLAVTNVKLNLANIGVNTDDSSERLSDYLDTVAVYMGSTKVGSADVADFTRTTGTPDVFSKTIALSNAVVRMGVSNKATFTVKVTAKDSIDSTDTLNAVWVVALDSLRYQDATGVIMSENNLDDNDYTTLESGDSLADYSREFTFQDASTNNSLDIISSTANPSTTTLEVKKNDISDSYLVGAFKLKAATDSNDIQINEIPVVMDVENNTVNSASMIDAVIDSVTVKIDGTEYSADLTTGGTFASGEGKETYLVTLDPGELVIGAGDTVEAKVYATFNDQENNYSVGTTVTAGVTLHSIDAEGVTSGDSVTVGGIFTGKAQTLSVDAPVATIEGTPTFALYSASTDSASSIYLATMKFNVTASDSADVFMSNDIPDDLVYTLVNTATSASLVGDVTSVTLTATNDIEQTHSFLVGAGTTEEFALKFYVKGSNVTGKVTVTGLKYGVDDVAAHMTSSITSLTNFKAQTYLAK